MTSSEPQQIGEFEILGLIGQGAMGAVYRARQTSLGRIVALKLLPAHYAAEAGFVARFRREAAAVAALNHPNIVQIYAAGEADGTHYYAMEYVEGETLGQRMKRKGRVAPHDAIAAALNVTRALEYAWNKARVIHRDIKPDNIFLSSKGAVKLGDLGLAKSLGAQTDAGLTQTGVTLGTPFYVSPEQAMAIVEIDFRSDFYSLGCTLYHAISGQPPYDGESTTGVMLKHVSEPPPKIREVWPDCPATIIGLLEKMLCKKPNERHRSHEALWKDLMWIHDRLQETEPESPLPGAEAAAVSDAPPNPAPGTVADAAVRWKPTRPRMVLVASALALGLAVVVGALLHFAPWKNRNTPGRTSAARPDTTSPSGNAARVKEVTLDTVKAAVAKLCPDAMSAKVTPWRDGKYVVDVSGLPIRDFTELHGMNVGVLHANKLPISDLSSLPGVGMQRLWIMGCPNLTDLSPLAKCAALEDINLSNSPVSDISPLKGLRLSVLALSDTRVTDLSPIRGMPLVAFYFTGTDAEVDVSPLLESLTLENITLPRAAKNVEMLRKLPAVKFISYRFDFKAKPQRPAQTAAEFWTEFERSKASPPSALPR